MLSEIKDLEKLLAEKLELNAQLQKAKSADQKVTESLRKTLEEETKAKSILLHQLQDFLIET